MLEQELPPNNKDQNNKKLFTIQYTKEELDKIQHDFVTQMNKYFDRINNRIIGTFEEIEKEAGDVELVPPSTIIVIKEQKEEGKVESK